MAGVTIQRVAQSVTSPWYNLFLELQLDPLQESVARQLVVEPVKGNYTYQDDALAQILHYSDLKPQEVQRLCWLSVNCMLDRTADAPWTPGAGVITAADVNQAVEAALRDKTGEYRALWITFSAQKQRALREVSRGNEARIALLCSPAATPLHRRGTARNHTTHRAGHRANPIIPIVAGEPAMTNPYIVGS